MVLNVEEWCSSRVSICFLRNCVLNKRCICPAECGCVKLMVNIMRQGNGESSGHMEVLTTSCRPKQDGTAPTHACVWPAVLSMAHSSKASRRQKIQYALNDLCRLCLKASHIIQDTKVAQVAVAMLMMLSVTCCVYTKLPRHLPLASTPSDVDTDTIVSVRRCHGSREGRSTYMYMYTQHH